MSADDSPNQAAAPPPYSPYVSPPARSLQRTPPSPSTPHSQTIRLPLPAHTKTYANANKRRAKIFAVVFFCAVFAAILYSALFCFKSHKIPPDNTVTFNTLSGWLVTLNTQLPGFGACGPIEKTHLNPSYLKMKPYNTKSDVLRDQMVKLVRNLTMAELGRSATPNMACIRPSKCERRCSQDLVQAMREKTVDYIVFDKWPIETPLVLGNWEPIAWW